MWDIMTRRELLLVSGSLVLCAKRDYTCGFLAQSGDVSGRRAVSATADAVRFLNSPERRRQYTGLMIGLGIAGAYSSGRINRTQAMDQFSTLTKSGVISDPLVLRNLASALEGSDPRLGEYQKAAKEYLATAGKLVAP